MKVCEPVIRSGANKNETATGTIAGVRRHHKRKEPACADCLAALKRWPHRSKAFMFKRDAFYEKTGHSYPVTRRFDPSIIR